MNVNKVIIITDEETLCIKPFGANYTVENDYLTDNIITFSCSFNSANMRNIPKKVYIVKEFCEKIMIFDRETKYDLNTGENWFSYGCCPNINYTVNANIDEIIWEKCECKKALKQYEDNGSCICASKFIAEVVKDMLEKQNTLKSVEKLVKDIDIVQVEAEELKKNISKNLNVFNED